MLDNKIITEWFQQYSDDIYHFLFYRLGTSEVEDLVQEVFIKAIKGHETYQEKASVKTWLLSIARNTAIDEIRRRNRAKLKNLISFEAKHEPKNEKNPEELLSLSEEHKELYQAIKRLKANYRDVIILRGIKELSVEETSAILTWNENKVRSTYHRARKALKEALGGV